MNTRKYFRIGEYSSGTLRAEDIAEAIAYEARDVKLTRKERNLTCEVETILRKCRGGFPSDREADLLGEYVNESGFSMIENHLPPYTYFGSMEGDGACIGVWPDIESAIRDAEEGEIATTAEDSPDYRGYVLDISDHGNVTLYNRTSPVTLREVWSVV